MIENNILFGATEENGDKWKLSSMGCYTTITRDNEGRFHSFDDKPALVDTLGVKIWAKHGFMHRDNDKPSLISSSAGQKLWSQNGLSHREGDKPAQTWRYQEDYFLFNCTHRVTGPAEAGSYFSLYGYRLLRNRHALIVENAIANKIPLYLAFLQWYLNVPSRDLDRLANLLETLPIAWVVKAMGGPTKEAKPLNQQSTKHFADFIAYENEIMKSSTLRNTYLNA